MDFREGLRGIYQYHDQKRDLIETLVTSGIIDENTRTIAQGLNDISHAVSTIAAIELDKLESEGVNKHES